jgi:hypothetical protein
VDTPEVGLTEELIPDMPEMQLEEHVIEESYEIPPGSIFFLFKKKSSNYIVSLDATDYIVPAIVEEEPVRKKATPKISHGKISRVRILK